MYAEQYIMKAELQLKRKKFDKAAESLAVAIESAKKEAAFPALIQANCFLGELFFIQQKYKEAKTHLSFILEHSDETESHDDLLDNELQTAGILLSMIERYVE
jgi:uncharacterized protein HemY